MPTYEYVCVDCGERVEVVQSFSDGPLEMCVACGGKLRKVFFPVGIQLKGGGFYSSERRAARPGSRKDAKADKAGEKADARSDGKTDSKTDSKAAASSSSDRPSKKVSEKTTQKSST
jgi:putative FmdB family regulatory protein